MPNAMPYDLRDAKRRNERASATLLHGYLTSIGMKLGDIRPGDPNKAEPDFLCPTPEGEIGIEATNVFYDQEHASWTWGMAIEADGGAAPHRVRGEPVVVHGRVIGEMSPLLVNPHVKLADATRELLAKKCAKAYTIPTYLMLDARQAVIVTAEDGPRIAASLRLPAGCPLRGAYLCLAESGTSTARFFDVPRE